MFEHFKLFVSKLLPASSVVVLTAIGFTQSLYSADLSKSNNLIVNGVPWYDQRDSIVSAHGANIIFDNGKYYMFGEFKTDSVNDFKGFSCYSSPDLVNWTFERIALNQQSDGIMGPNRVGERPKVLKSPATGEYIMIMHSDNPRYKEPCVAYATSNTINGEYTFKGPLLYKGKPIKKWDIGSFVDNDGKSYLLVHHGEIYRFADNLMSLDSCMCKGVAGIGESPAMVHKDGKYYWFSSHTTSWERNDNMYVSSESLAGPWEQHEMFAPKGSNTWNSQTSFVLPVIHDNDTTYMFMGDRWSFPKQRSAATYVWLPLQWKDGEPYLPEYWESWNPLTMKRDELPLSVVSNSSWRGEKPGDSMKYLISLNENDKIYIKGSTDDKGAYAEIKITDEKGNVIVETPVDFYSLAPAHGLRYISPQLKKGRYTVTVTVSEMRPNWKDKKRSDYGSKGYEVAVDEIGICRIADSMQSSQQKDKPRFHFDARNPDVHDPVMAFENGRYYLFNTGMGISMLSSDDLKTWKMEKRVLDPAPEWAKEPVPAYKGHTWAPDIIKVGDRWYLYYSCSTFGKNISAIGVATNKTLNPESQDYKWEDLGMVIKSQPGENDWNAIDPNVILDRKGNPWMTFGSFWDGIQLIRLKKDMKTPNGKSRTIARKRRPCDIAHNATEAGANAIEAPFLTEKDGWYYLFVSHDYCCKGLKSDYKTVVGRSKKIEGPYLDREGRDMAHGGGTILIGPNDDYAGVGHCSVYKFGDRWIFAAHGYDRLKNGASKLVVSDISWDSEGWPSLN